MRAGAAEVHARAGPGVRPTTATSGTWRRVAAVLRIERSSSRCSAAADPRRLPRRRAYGQLRRPRARRAGSPWPCSTREPAPAPPQSQARPAAHRLGRPSRRRNQRGSAPKTTPPTAPTPQCESSTTAPRLAGGICLSSPPAPSLAIASGTRPFAGRLDTSLSFRHTGPVRSCCTSGA